MKLAIVNDTHMGARGDSLLFNDYFFRFWDNVFFPYCKSNNITNILHLGDLVDRRKFTNHIILHQWNKKWFERTQKNSISVNILVGNHDIPFRNTNTPNAIQELFGHYNNVDIISHPQYHNYDGLDVLLLPWINEGNNEDSLRMIKEKCVSIAFGHLELVGFEMDKGNIMQTGMDRSIFDNYEAVYSGHYHHKSSDGTIFYLGTQYEMTWADFGSPKGFHVFDTNTRQMEFVPNPERMFFKHVYDNGAPEPVIEEVTDKYIKVIVKNRDDIGLFDAYIEKLHKLNHADIEIVEYGFSVDSNNITFEVDETDDLISDMEKYIDSQVIPVGKKQVVDVLRDIHLEALNMEIK